MTALPEKESTETRATSESMLWRVKLEVGSSTLELRVISILSIIYFIASEFGYISTLTQRLQTSSFDDFSEPKV